MKVRSPRPLPLLVATAAVSGSGLSACIPASDPLPPKKAAGSSVEGSIGLLKLESNHRRFQERALSLFELLINKKFDQLQQAMESACKGPPRDINAAQPLRAIVYEWVDKEPMDNIDFLSRLDAWVAAYSDSAIPLVARGMYYHKRAWSSRGEAFANLTSDEQFAGFHKYLALALPDFQKAIKLDPNNRSAWTGLVQISITSTARRAGVTPEKAFGLAQKKFPDDYWIHFYRMRALQVRWGGSTNDTLAFARRVTRDAPDDSLLHTLILNAHWERADWLSIRQYKPSYGIFTLQGMLNSFSKRSSQQRKPMREYLSRNDVLQEVTTAMAKLEQYHPEFYHGYLTYAQILRMAGRMDVAERYFVHLLEIDPGFSTQPLYWLSWIASKGKKYQASLSYAVRGHQIFPNSHVMKERIALAYSNLGQRKRSAELHAELVEANPRSAEYWASLCSELAGIRSLKKAMEACNTSIELDPTDGWPYHLKGWTYRFMGEEELAVKNIKKAKAMGWKGYD